MQRFFGTCLAFMVLAFLLLASPFAAFAASADVAQKNTGEPIVQARLLADVSAVAPGQTFGIALEQVIRKDWHLYWENPGDSGTATHIAWELPAGFEAGEIQWPVPERETVEGLSTYVFKNSVTLPIRMTVPDPLPPGKEVMLKANVDWLVCKETCIPETADLTLILPVAANVTDVQPANQTLFAKAREKLPQAVDWPVAAAEDNGNLVLTVTTGDLPLAKTILAAENIFPAKWGVIKNEPKAAFAISPAGDIVITAPRDSASLKDEKNFRFVLANDHMDSAARGFTLHADLSGLAPPVEAAPVPAPVPTAVVAPQDADAPIDVNAIKPPEMGGKILQALLLAFAGGLVLNLMPCVFPILSIKAISLVHAAHGHRRDGVIHGLAYTAGVVLSFLAIAGVLLALRAAGSELGWGFQLQNPVMVMLLGWLMFAVGLNLAGFYEIGTSLQNIGNRHPAPGALGAFGTGLLATVVATPCTAPFMGFALGFAMTQATPIALLIFATLGLGLAMPFLLLSIIPSLQKMLPRPGAWMEILKETLSFPMFIAAVWLVWVLAQQIGLSAIWFGGGGMVLLGLAIWLRRFGLVPRILSVLVFAMALVGLPILLPQELPKTADTVPVANQATPVGEWQPFTQVALDAALATDAPVFVDMTAAWCITCKVNEKSSLDIASTKKIFKEKGVVLFQGDWTNYDKAITAYLAQFGRNGVPIYVYYAAPDAVTKQRPAPKVLPQILTPAIVSDALQH